MLRSNTDYQAALEIIRQAINAWDPYGPIAGDAGLDEFDQEVALVVARIPKIDSPESSVSHVSEIFTHQFGTDHFGLDACRDVGETIFAQLREAGLLSISQESAS